MSAIASNDASNAVGFIKMRHAEKENYYCCRWTIKGDVIYDENKELTSPVFTIPLEEKCKWYFTLETMNDGEDKGAVFHCVQLVLDPSSDCKAAIAKFQGSVLFWPHGRQRRLETSRTFKFDRKSDNKANILSVGRQRYLGYYSDHDDDEGTNEDKNKPEVRFECDIMIEASIPEDNSFPNDFGSLLKNQWFSDVVLSVGEKKFPAHKAILAARSSVFAAMFAPNAAENQDVVNIEDMSEDVVEEMLRYIYTGEVGKLNDLARDLLIVAGKYDLKGLRSKCEEILIESLSSSNAFDSLLLAELHNANYLKFEAINFITVRNNELMKTAAWESLKQINPDLFQEIVEARGRLVKVE